MKLSSISSSAIQNAMRLTIKQSQNEMTQSSLEATTGVYADLGVSLGGNIAQSIDMTRDISRIDSITNSNSAAAARMTASQTALTDMTSQGQSLLDQLIALQGNQSGSSVNLSQTTASGVISAFTADANTMLSGQYIFAGTNTDVQPITDQTASATTAIQNNLQAYASLKGTTVDALTSDQMTDFITNYVAPAFTGVPVTPAPATTPATPAFVTIPDWSSWSAASSQNMSSRINNSEVVDTSTNTNQPGMRYLALSTTIVNALMGQNISSSALGAVTSSAISYTRQGIDGFNAQASQLGLSQARVTKANDALSAQKDIINNRIVDLQGVDPYEASTKVNSLETQLETAYTIVSKIQQLSLVNYL
jgi:flagellar hook-associated protein 3 FlgL